MHGTARDHYLKMKNGPYGFPAFVFSPLPSAVKLREGRKMYLQIEKNMVNIYPTPHASDIYEFSD
jgi:hypothetical protein